MSVKTRPFQSVACNAICDLHRQKRVLAISRWISWDLDEWLNPMANSLEIQVLRRLGCHVMPFEYPLCSNHRAAFWLHRIGPLLLFWGWFELCLPGIITMAGPLPFYMTLFGIALCVLGFLAVLFGFNLNVVSKQDGYLCFVGAGASFLDSLASWPGRRFDTSIAMRIVGALLHVRNRIFGQIERLVLKAWRNRTARPPS